MTTTQVHYRGAGSAPTTSVRTVFSSEAEAWIAGRPVAIMSESGASETCRYARGSWTNSSPSSVRGESPPTRA